MKDAEIARLKDELKTVGLTNQLALKDALGTVMRQ